MIAQGEKNEEIVVGLMIGIALDLMYSIFLLVRNKYKIITSIFFMCIVVVIIGFFFSASYVNDRTNEYKAKYFSDKNDYIKISESIVQHYESNELQGEMTIWCFGGESEVIYGDSKNQESSLDISVPFKQNEVDEIVKISLESNSIWQEVIAEAIPWVSECFEENEVFTILGM